MSPSANSGSLRQCIFTQAVQAYVKGEHESSTVPATAPAGTAGCPAPARPLRGPLTQPTELAARWRAELAPLAGSCAFSGVVLDTALSVVLLPERAGKHLACLHPPQTPAYRTPSAVRKTILSV